MPTAGAPLLAVLFACSVLLGPLAQAQATGGGNPLLAPSRPVIFIAAADGTGAWPLIEGLGPAWSPDGTQIAFYREGTDFRTGDLFIIDADGFGGYWAGPGIEPAWAPEGSRIAFTSAAGIDVREHPQSVRVRTLLAHDFLAGLPWGTDAEYDMGVGKPAWSPDGRRIAFEHLGDGDMAPAQVYLMYADGSEVQRLSPESGIRYAESDPAWSPDGTRIALWSWGHGLATITVANRVPHTVYFDFPTVAYGAHPTWSPDGSKIAFVTNGALHRSIWVVDSAGGSPSELIARGYDPAWSPDGNYLAFVRDVTEDVPVPGFPLVPGAAAVYDRDRAHTSPLDARSRYVFHGDDSFELQYVLASGQSFGYGGTYVQTGRLIEFEFDDNRPQWRAEGRLSEDDRILQVEHNEMMLLDDFENGVYVLAGSKTKRPVKEPDEPLDPPASKPKCATKCADKAKPGGKQRRSVL